MEPMFTTETRYTLDEYKKYNHAVLWKIKKVPVTILLLELILLGISYFTKDMTYILGALLVPLIFKIVLGIQARKTYGDNPRIHNVVFSCSFYEDFMEQSSVLGSTRIYYREIYKVHETGTNFYLMIGRDAGSIIVKKNCSAELIQFLKNLRA